MRAKTGSSVVLGVLLFCAVCFGQTHSSSCDSNESILADCPSLNAFGVSQKSITAPQVTSIDRSHPVTQSLDTSGDDHQPADVPSAPVPSEDQSFHWRRALTESFTFLVIEQAYVVHTDFNWVVSENGIPFNHYWRDYKQSLTTWWHAGWSAGEDPLYNYVGHPIQGALTSYIQIQNDPKSEKLEFANTKTYWKSRLKATLWNAVYSTQWSIGPLSEMTVEKYGSKDRPPWNANGSFPCNTKTCYWGVGKVNLVMTPVGGFGWLLAEEAMDKKITEELVESHTQNRLLINTVRSALNPIHGGANILHGNRPWYRPRDLERGHLFVEPKNAVVPAEPAKPIPSHGDIFVGYIHLGESHCQNIYTGVGIVCDPLSAKTSSLGGWNVAVEKKYLRYFGAIADFSGAYGAASQSNFLFGIRGGASIGRLRPFAQVLFGAVHARENSAGVPRSDTSFAEDLGVGIDFRLARLLSWRFETDELKTGTPTFERYNVRVSSGMAIRF
jgi:hypothetical protein